jgi:hypothetical protein
MSRIPGVALTSLWESPALVWQERVQIAKTLAGYVKQLTSFKFPLIGSLFPSSRPEFERVAWLKGSSSEARFLPLLDNAEFAQGPVVIVPFFYGDRIYLRDDCGPFKSSSKYLSSLLRLHIASAMTEKAAASADNEYDEDDISELEDVIAAYEALLSVLPAFFPSDSSDTETCSLHHDDLSSDNILIDPTTHRITGIVDWECVSLQPSWKVAQVPHLLNGPEFDDGSPIPDAAPPPDKDADEFHQERRDCLEQMLLRRIFYKELGGKPKHGSRERLFENKIYQVDIRAIAIRRWVNEVQQGLDPFPTKMEGDPYFWPEH